MTPSQARAHALHRQAVQNAGVGYIEPPLTIPFVMDTSRLTPTDIYVIESALRTVLIEHGADAALIDTLRKIEKVLRHPAVTLVGGTIPAHVPGAYPDLSCCGGTKVMLVQNKEV